MNWLLRPRCPPGSAALDREAAMRLLAELQALEERLRRLRDGIERVLACFDP